MQWREPKIKGMVTGKNILTALGLIILLSIPFGFLGGHGQYRLSTSLLSLAFMSFGILGLIIQPLLPGTRVRLTDNAIVRSLSRRTEKSPYKEIECIYFYRDCSYSWYEGVPIVKVHERTVEGPNFTNLQVQMKNEVMVDGEVEFSRASAGCVHNFAVPSNVNVERVLEILRDKGVKIVEPALVS
jgi:hypothetical protein